MLQNYLSPNEQTRKRDQERSEEQPQELPDRYEQMMDAYCNPDHPDHKYACRIMEAEQHTDLEAWKIYNELFFSKVASRPSTSGTGGRKWFDKSAMDETEDLIQDTIESNTQEHLDNEDLVPVTHTEAPLFDDTYCDMCRDKEVAPREHQYQCDECEHQFCRSCAIRDDKQAVCPYCYEDVYEN